MNSSSLALCEGSLKPGGLLVINSTLVKESPKRKDIKVVMLDASGLADKLGNIRFANMVALGAVAKLTGALSLQDIEPILKNFFPEEKHKFVPKNVEAIHAGYAAV
jgi:2-oxoglutarate ferredoxin oxidoreductase subunit gamma